MKKKILIGSLLVLTLLLLMPSIPAIQQKTIEDKAYDDLQEKLDTINLNDLGDIEKLDWVRHPILHFIVFLILDILLIIPSFFGEMAYLPNFNFLMIFLALLTSIPGFLWFYPWYIISTLLQWNWEW